MPVIVDPSKGDQWANVAWTPGETYIQAPGTIANENIAIGADGVKVIGYHAAIDCTGLPTDTIGIDYGSAENVEVRGFTIRNTPGRGVRMAIAGTPPGQKLIDIIAHDLAQDATGQRGGIQLRGSGFLAQNVKVHNAPEDAFTLNVDPNTSGTMIELDGWEFGDDVVQGDWMQASVPAGCGSMTWLRCKMKKRNKAKHGVLAYGSASAVFKFIDCEFSLAPRVDVNMTAINIGAGAEVIVEDCRFYGNWYQCFNALISAEPGITDAVRFRRNLIVGAERALHHDDNRHPGCVVEVVGNTIVDGGSAVIAPRRDVSAPTTIKNNVFVDCRGNFVRLKTQSDPQWDIDHNSYYSTHGAGWRIDAEANITTFADWQAAGHDANGRYGPSRTLANGVPAADSPLLGAGEPGVSGKRDSTGAAYVAAAPAMGAFEPSYGRNDG